VRGSDALGVIILAASRGHLSAIEGH
jgi:hypothetical protein